MKLYEIFKKKYDLESLDVKFKNKNILVFDLETTWLTFGVPILNVDNYEVCKNNNKFRNARIIQIGWSYVKKFNGVFNINNIKAKYRKSKELTKITNSNIHNITIDMINTHGLFLSTILNKT